MNLQRIAEHTIDVDLLPLCPTVLDVGCRGFEFSKEILKLRPKAIIAAFDPDPYIQNPNIARIHYYRKAIVGNSDESRWYLDEGGNGNRIVPEALPNAIPVFTVGINYALSNYDLVKLDCEGSEFEILENWTGSCAGQLSIEFHDYLDREKWNDAYFEKLFRNQLKDYQVVQHELSPVGPNKTLGHWDSLLVRR